MQVPDLSGSPGARWPVVSRAARMAGGSNVPEDRPPVGYDPAEPEDVPDARSTSERAAALVVWTLAASASAGILAGTAALIDLLVRHVFG